MVKEWNSKKKRLVLALLLAISALFCVLFWHLSGLSHRGVYDQRSFVNLTSSGTATDAFTFTADEKFRDLRAITAVNGQIRTDVDAAAEVDHQTEAETRVVAASLTLLDKAGTVLWDRPLSDLTMAQYLYEPDAEIAVSPELPGIALTPGEAYTLLAVDAEGNAIPDVIWILQGGSQSLLPAYLILCLILLALLSVVYLWLMGLGKLPETAVYLILLFGLSVAGMLVMTPPSVPDELLHFGNAMAESTRLLSLIPGCGDLAQQTAVGALHQNIFGPAQYRALFWSSFENFGTLIPGASNFFRVGHMPGYAYYAPALGLTLVRLLHAPFQFYILTARLFNVTLYAVLSLIAMKACPKLKTAVLAVTFLPSSLWMIASCSYDVWNLAFAILLVCLTMKYREEERLKLPQIAALLITAALLIPVKFVYFNLLLIFLVLSAKQIPEKSRKRIRNIGIGAGILLVAVIAILRGREIFMFLTPYGFDNRLDPGAETPYSILTVLRHPLYTALVCVHTLFLNADTWILQLFATESYGKYIPHALTILILLCFFVVMALTFRQEEVSHKMRLVCIAILATGVLIILASFLLVYTTYNPERINEVYGIQGRYFLPYLLVLPLILQLPKKMSGETDSDPVEGVLFNREQMAKAALALQLVLVLVTLLTRFAQI